MIRIALNLLLFYDVKSTHLFVSLFLFLQEITDISELNVVKI